ncbi:hypothetical protein DPMN_024790 [Dreissena polymorpha]|uniref:Uncharacterized protein n=1 Tax=Dreissena polymorpha TaxID=45954 RepID=A0A9D4RB85_DREPO|nr:hypothetical protein DPMN_024790 [Dreissena polymorpha]
MFPVQKLDCPSNVGRLSTPLVILTSGKHIYSRQQPVHKRPYSLVLPSMHNIDLSLVPNHEVCAHFVDRAPAQQWALN